mgnify:CR=1 FL=1
MKLPEVQRDYVILNELAHLNHMDHSKAFWTEVGKHDKNYKVHLNLKDTRGNKSLELFLIDDDEGLDW